MVKYCTVSTLHERKCEYKFLINEEVFEGTSQLIGGKHAIVIIAKFHHFTKRTQLILLYTKTILRVNVTKHYYKLNNYKELYYGKENASITFHCTSGVNTRTSLPSKL